MLLLAVSLTHRPAPAAEPGGELVTNVISGVVRFTNTDPGILARLDAPGDEGVTAISVSAYTDPPAILTASTFRYTDQRLANDYELIVQVDQAGFVYHVLATMSLDVNSEGYYSAIYDSPLLASNGPPAVVNIEECVGLVELRYQRANGDPVAVGGARVKAIETVTDRLRAEISRQTVGLTGNFLVVPSGVELRLHIEVDTGTDLYSDRLTHAETRIVTVACDETQVVMVTVPEVDALGTITGNLDMLGEFELSTEGYLEFLGRSAVLARGPMGNQRNDLLPGDNVALPSSGTFTLENLAPSALTDPAEPWRVQAEMHFRTGRRFEYFISPALGQGENPGVTVTAGETANLDNTFQMNPGLIVGNIFLKGPLEFGGNTSALRGLSSVDHFDTDADGIPDGVGISGIGSSYVTATGVDTIAGGATYSASGGYAGAGFEGAFNPTNSAYEGDYELVVAGLNGEPSIWKRDSLSLTIYDPGTNGGPYVNQVVYVTDTAPTPLTVRPEQRLTNDVRLGLAEVCVRFRSSGAAFFGPRIRFSTGTLDGPDFENNERHHSTYIDIAAGLPVYAEGATNEAVVTMYLPEGTYDFSPYVSTLNAEGVASETQLNSINDISVVAGERYCVEECIRIVLPQPTCTANFGFLATADAFSCEATLTNLSLRSSPLSDPSIRLGYSDIRILEPAGMARTTLRTAHGLFPEFDGFDRSLYRDIVYTAIAKDNKGRIATRTIIAHYDLTPPVLECTDMTVTAANGVDAVVDYNVPIPSDDILTCTPPSGSTFPIGTTPVTCTARDLCHNTNTCAFNVTVRDPNEDCVLRIALTQVSPPEVTLTWDCTATLQSAEAFDGLWTSLSGVTSPYTMPADGPYKFFRLCLSGDCGTPAAVGRPQRRR